MIYLKHRKADHQEASLRRRIALLKSAMAEIRITGHYKNEPARYTDANCMLALLEEYLYCGDLYWRDC